MFGCKPVETPTKNKIKNHKLGKGQENVVVEYGIYQHLVGNLIYWTNTSLDIANVVNVVSQFMHCPKEVHLQVVYKILHYLKSTPGKEFCFKKNEKLS